MLPKKERTQGSVLVETARAGKLLLANMIDPELIRRQKEVTVMEGFVGVKVAAAFLDVKISWLYEMVRLGKVPSYKVGPFRRFKLSELDAWAREHGLTHARVAPV